MSWIERGVRCLRVWSGVGHGEKSWLGVLSGEVLIGELLTVDRLATSALYTCETVLCAVVEERYERCHG